MPRKRRSRDGLGALLLSAASLVLIAALCVAIYRVAQQGPAQRPPARQWTGDRVRIAFWNVRNLSLQSRDIDERRMIADIVRQFDAVAICEVSDADILPALASLLEVSGERWESITSPKVGNTQGSAEHYGVLFRGDVFDLLSAEVLPEQPLRETGVAGLPRDAMFDRDPFAVSLKTDNGRLDFALLVAHVTYGEVVAPRTAEVRLLASYYHDVFRRENDVLLGGDFNRKVGDANSLGWLMDETGLIDTVDPDVPTVVRGRNTFDHILLHPRFTTEYTGRHGVVRFDEELFPGDPAAAEKAISDHRPVWIELAVPEQDDD